MYTYIQYTYITIQYYRISIVCCMNVKCVLLASKTQKVKTKSALQKVEREGGGELLASIVQ